MSKSKHFLPPLPSNSDSNNNNNGKQRLRITFNSQPKMQIFGSDEYAYDDREGAEVIMKGPSETFDTDCMSVSSGSKKSLDSSDLDSQVDFLQSERSIRSIPHGLLHQDDENLNLPRIETWPETFDDSVALKRMETLPPTNSSILNRVKTDGKVQVRSVTWNQEAQPLPNAEFLRKHLFPKYFFHIVAVGTQECENSFTKSILSPSKENWEKLCNEAIGEEYELVRAHALQASHLAVFVHTAILSLITDVESIAIPTGMYDKLGNKGGIGITLQVANSSFCFLTAHLSAHQDQMDRRIDEFRKISSEVARQLGKPLRVKQRDKSTHVEQRDDYELSSQLSTTNPLLDAFDFIIWGGDFNFRIHGTRDIVDRLLLHNQHRILVDNDQLSMLLNYDATFRGISEGVPTFRPTYKFDRHSDVYDSSSKRRIPSWTDRILYKKHSSIKLLSYSSSAEIRTSDHRPVYASFLCSIKVNRTTADFDENENEKSWTSETRSEVCVIS